jgi:predicted ATP-binding protein involved in virulence
MDSRISRTAFRHNTPRRKIRSPVDIDRALHPRAQRSLVAMLRAILEATPQLQIIASSHSPYLVDEMRPEEVVVLGRNANGVVVAKRLDAFPDERLRSMLSTGELWMSEGDDWVAR